MGTSALVSALNALPWEGDEEDSDSSDDDDNVQSHPPQAARPQGKQFCSIAEGCCRTWNVALISSIKNALLPTHDPTHVESRARSALVRRFRRVFP